MYNNGYVKGFLAEVKYTLNDMKSNYAAKKSISNMNQPTPKVVASANSAHPGRGYEDFYFRLVCTKEYFGIEQTYDSMIVQFKDAQDRPMPLKEVYKILSSVSKVNRDYMTEIKQVAYSWGGGIVSFQSGPVVIKGRTKFGELIKMRKMYIEKDKQDELIQSGFAIEIKQGSRANNTK